MKNITIIIFILLFSINVPYAAAIERNKQIAERVEGIILQEIEKGIEFYYVFGEEAKLDVTVMGEFTTAVSHTQSSRIEVLVSLPEGNEPRERVLYCFYNASRSRPWAIEISSCWIKPKDGIIQEEGLPVRTLRINICPSGSHLKHDVGHCVY